MGESGLASARYIVQVGHKAADSLAAAAERLFASLIAGHEEIEVGRAVGARTVAQDLQAFAVIDW